MARCGGEKRQVGEEANKVLFFARGLGAATFAAVEELAPGLHYELRHGAHFPMFERLEVHEEEEDIRKPVMAVHGGKGPLQDQQDNSAE